MAALTLTALYRYPVKSLGGEEYPELDVEGRGLAFDRQWMVVDAQGGFLTQRQQARMTLIGASVDDRGLLRLCAPGMPDMAVRSGADADQRVEVTIWGDSVSAMPAGHEADAWLSEFLALPCRLVCFPQEQVRAVDPGFSRPPDQVGFADGFPFLLISQASLDDLNGRLQDPVPMLRFRPNLVVEGCEAFAEDGWRRIRIGDVDFRVAKPCSRCVIPTIDLATGERGKEPLRTLMTYRRRDNKVYFGQNLIHDGVGRLAAGMTVEVLE
jgi:uncharacterized protein YcbX